MNKKKIKGGIQLQSKDIENENYKIDGITDVTYKKGFIETEKKKKFKLYKITDIDKYLGEEFILPDISVENGIQKEKLKHIYLFGYSGELTQQLFVRKNASDKISPRQISHIGKNLNLLFKTFQKASLNIILIYSEEDDCLFIIFDMSKSQNKHYKKFEGLFSPAFFVSDEKLKKQINISDLKLLIDYTYKKISYASLYQKQLDSIKTNLNDNRLKEIDNGEKKLIQDEIKKIQNKIYEFEEDILKDSKNDNDNGLNSSINSLKEEFNKFLESIDPPPNGGTFNDLRFAGGYKKKLKRKELNTLSLAELKQLHRSNGIKMNNNRNKIGLINNYIKNNVNN